MRRKVCRVNFAVAGRDGEHVGSICTYQEKGATAGIIGNDLHFVEMFDLVHFCWLVDAWLHAYTEIYCLISLHQKTD